MEVKAFQWNVRPRWGRNFWKSVRCCVQLVFSMFVFSPIDGLSWVFHGYHADGCSYSLVFWEFCTSLAARSVVQDSYKHRRIPGRCYNKCLWGKARMCSAYHFNLLMYFLALRIGTRRLPVISFWVYPLYSQRWKSWQLYTCLPSLRPFVSPLSPLCLPFLFSLLALACSCCLAWFPLLLHRWKLLSLTVLKRMRKRVATKEFVRRLRGSVSQNLISDLVWASFAPRSDLVKIAASQNPATFESRSLPFLIKFLQESHQKHSFRLLFRHIWDSCVETRPDGDLENLAYFFKIMGHNCAHASWWGFGKFSDRKVHCQGSKNNTST